MLYKLFYSFHEVYSPFNVFRYITFRTVLAVITALVITFVMAPWVTVCQG
jgi:phospho-N-acetylmuramoyl-pentapeptide-transferase